MCVCVCVYIYIYIYIYIYSAFVEFCCSVMHFVIGLFNLAGGFSRIVVVGKSVMKTAQLLLALGNVFS